MKVITETFKIEHQIELSRWENNNKISSKLILTLLNLKKFTNFNTFLISDDLYFILDSNPSFNWTSKQYPNPVHFIEYNCGYWDGGDLMGNKIYYNKNIDKIYCSDSITKIHKYLKKELRRKKLKQINEL